MDFENHYEIETAADHALRPDEALMEQEDGPGIDSAEPSVARQETFNALFSELFSVQQNAEDVGWCAWAVCWLYAPDLLPAVDKHSTARMMRSGILSLGDVDPSVVRGLMQLLTRPITKEGWKATTKLGKRVMVFAYLSCRSEAVRRTLPSLEVIGRLWGLRAANKRSAPGAAVQKIKDELLGYYLRTGHRREDIIMPGQKSEESREKYRAAAMGNNHRKGK
jgi:hypothetical protein